MTVPLEEICSYKVGAERNLEIVEEEREISLYELSRIPNNCYDCKGHNEKCEFYDRLLIRVNRRGLLGKFLDLIYRGEIK